MTTIVAYPATMADLRGDPAHSSLWSSYGGPLQQLPGRTEGIPTTSPPLSGPARSTQTATMDQQPPYPYSRYPQEETEGYERPPPSTLGSYPSFPNLKRSFSETEPPAYQEIVQDLRDDGSKLTVNNDHKLLAFRKTQDKHTILNQHGRLQQLELSAQLHGMFFLSEMPANSVDGNSLQPELTCYRRNLFQVSGSLITPRGQLSVVTEAGETVGVSSTEVTISAIESVDGNPVRLIVIPWKTPPPNSPETSQAPDQEPQSLPLIPFQDDGNEVDGEFAVYPIGWRRLQFRIATANNGRRKELQQHFVLHLKVMGTLANGTKVALSESTTAPIVVRGRSPRNFQARKEIPLLGSSAGSRGQALVETGLGVVAGALNLKQQEAKARGIEGQLPRTAFTFSAQKLPGGGQLASMRSNSYPTWNSPTQLQMPQLPPTSGGNYPPTTMGTDPFSKLPIAGAPSFTAEPQEMSLPTTMAPSVPMPLVGNDQQQSGLRHQYTYVHTTTAPPQLSLQTSPLAAPEHALNIPRYVDNPRPTKSPRHGNQPSIHGTNTLPHQVSSPDYRYGSFAAVNPSPGDVGQPNYNTESAAPTPATSRDYYSSSATWTTAAGKPSPTVAYASGESRSYSFSQEQFKASEAPAAKPDSSQPPMQPQAYSEGHRGSFDPIGQYTWDANLNSST